MACQLGPASEAPEYDEGPEQHHLNGSSSHSPLQGRRGDGVSVHASDPRGG